MTAVHYNSALSDNERRAAVYAGDLFVFSPTASSRALADFACGMVAEAFGQLDQARAQFELPVARYVAILADLKPAFSHHARCKALLVAVV